MSGTSSRHMGSSSLVHDVGGNMMSGGNMLPLGAHPSGTANVIHVFNTELANEAATEVRLARYSSIVDYHLNRPETKNFIEQRLNYGPSLYQQMLSQTIQQRPYAANKSKQTLSGSNGSGPGGGAMHSGASLPLGGGYGGPSINMMNQHQHSNSLMHSGGGNGSSSTSRLPPHIGSSAGGVNPGGNAAGAGLHHSNPANSSGVGGQSHSFLPPSTSASAAAAIASTATGSSMHSFPLTPVSGMQNIKLEAPSPLPPHPSPRTPGFLGALGAPPGSLCNGPSGQFMSNSQLSSSGRVASTPSNAPTGASPRGSIPPHSPAPGASAGGSQLMSSGSVSRPPSVKREQSSPLPSGGGTIQTVPRTPKTPHSPAISGGPASVGQPLGVSCSFGSTPTHIGGNGGQPSMGASSKFFNNAPGAGIISLDQQLQSVPPSTLSSNSLPNTPVSGFPMSTVTVTCSAVTSSSSPASSLHVSSASTSMPSSGGPNFGSNPNLGPSHLSQQHCMSMGGMDPSIGGQRVTPGSCMSAGGGNYLQFNNYSSYNPVSSGASDPLQKIAKMTEDPSLYDYAPPTSKRSKASELTAEDMSRRQEKLRTLENIGEKLNLGPMQGMPPNGPVGPMGHLPPGAMMVGPNGPMMPQRMIFPGDRAPMHHGGPGVMMGAGYPMGPGPMYLHGPHPGSPMFHDGQNFVVYRANGPGGMVSMPTSCAGGDYQSMAQAEWANMLQSHQIEKQKNPNASSAGGPGMMEGGPRGGAIMGGPGGCPPDMVMMADGTVMRPMMSSFGHVRGPMVVGPGSTGARGSGSGGSVPVSAAPASVPVRKGRGGGRGSKNRNTNNPTSTAAPQPVFMPNQDMVPAQFMGSGQGMRPPMLIQGPPGTGAMMGPGPGGMPGGFDCSPDMMSGMMQRPMTPGGGPMMMMSGNGSGMNMMGGDLINPGDHQQMMLMNEPGDLFGIGPMGSQSGQWNEFGSQGSLGSCDGMFFNTSDPNCPGNGFPLQVPCGAGTPPNFSMMQQQQPNGAPGGSGMMFGGMDPNGAMMPPTNSTVGMMHMQSAGGMPPMGGAGQMIGSVGGMKVPIGGSLSNQTPGGGLPLRGGLPSSLPQQQQQSGVKRVASGMFVGDDQQVQHMDGPMAGTTKGSRGGGRAASSNTSQQQVPPQQQTPTVNNTYVNATMHVQQLNVQNVSGAPSVTQNPFPPGGLGAIEGALGGRMPGLGGEASAMGGAAKMNVQQNVNMQNTQQQFVLQSMDNLDSGAGMACRATVGAVMDTMGPLSSMGGSSMGGGCDQSGFGQQQPATPRMMNPQHSGHPQRAPPPGSCEFMGTNNGQPSSSGNMMYGNHGGGGTNSSAPGAGGGRPPGYVSEPITNLESKLPSSTLFYYPHSSSASSGTGDAGMGPTMQQSGGSSANNLTSHQQQSIASGSQALHQQQHFNSNNQQQFNANNNNGTNNNNCSNNMNPSGMRMSATGVTMMQGMSIQQGNISFGAGGGGPGHQGTAGNRMPAHGGHPGGPNMGNMMLMSDGGLHGGQPHPGDQSMGNGGGMGDHGGQSVPTDFNMSMSQVAMSQSIKAGTVTFCGGGVGPGYGGGNANNGSGNGEPFGSSGPGGAGAGSMGPGHGPSSITGQFRPMLSSNPAGPGGPPLSSMAGGPVPIDGEPGMYFGDFKQQMYGGANNRRP